MPTLEWIGKRAVVNHHREIPFRLLQCDPELSVGDQDSGNLLIEGDNLHALKALLPYYAGKVKCIFIDPPYNTGNEGWVYNDNVNSPEIRKWLGEVVGREAEDLSRHDKWLCMMYPRLALLREFLTEDGALFVTIGSDEDARLRLLVEEIFGSANLVGVAVWESAYTANQTARNISEVHNSVLIACKRQEVLTLGKFSRSEEQRASFRNPDSDPRGDWKAENLSAGKFYSQGQFEITGPTGRVFRPPPGRFWRCNTETFEQWRADGRIWWGKSGDSRPMLKKYFHELQGGLTPTTWWPHSQFGSTKEASLELKSIFGGLAVFPTPKPIKLVSRVLELFGAGDYLVLDSFAGSGTTGHAVLEANRRDRGERRFILIELQESICRDVTRERLARVMGRQESAQGEGGGEAYGIGGGVRYCRLGVPLFDESGRIRESVKFAELAAHVFFSETGTPIAKRASGRTPMLGVHEGRAIYLLFNGVLGDRKPAGGNVLTREVLAALPAHEGPRVIYGESCRLSRDRLSREGIVFKQVPYEVRVG